MVRCTSEVVTITIEEVYLNNTASENEVHKFINADDTQKANEWTKLPLEEIHLGDNSDHEGVSEFLDIDDNQQIEDETNRSQAGFPHRDGNDHNCKMTAQKARKK
ncbi:hypothetical protein J6590_022525 [Homalodisca vitripennis]|nr:hypothetical protein J6590_022525 [Homalodisca vitripennis]